MKQSDAQYKALAYFVFREIIEDAHKKYNISDENMKEMNQKSVNRAMFILTVRKVRIKQKRMRF